MQNERRKKKRKTYNLEGLFILKKKFGGRGVQEKGNIRRHVAMN